MKTFYRILGVLILSSIIVNCSSGESTSGSSNFTDNFGGVASRDFMGQVVDESNQPMSGVSISVGTSTQLTDSKGFFMIKSATVYKKFALIKAIKSGYIDGSRSVVPNSGMSTIKIMMLSATVTATVATGAPSSATLSNGAKVSFDGQFKTESGTAYTGAVKVLFHHLDPSDVSTSDKMPGMLMGENSIGAQCSLETYGMENVILEGSNGEKLEPSTTATIEMPITASQLATAPESIPLWHFDQAKGYWIEEGSATKVGNKYVGTVSHFSWWNCDAPFPTVSLGITVVNSAEQPMDNVRVEFVRTNQGSGVNGYTNAAGEVSGLIPANEPLTINVYTVNLACGNQLFYTQQVGPFSQNTALQIVADNTTIQSILVAGKLTNCNNANITNGYVWLQYGNQYLFTNISNGDFSFTVLNCASTITSITLQGYDFDSLKSTTLTSNTLINRQTISIATLQACLINSNASVIDIDGNVYNTVQIGTQNWMQTNLNVSKYRNGDVIPQVTDPIAWGKLTTGAWCYYENNTANGTVYGKLYNWYAVNDPRGLAPAGYHIPSRQDWYDLTTLLGGEVVAGGKMKATTTWLYDNINATNSSGFTALPGGFRYDSGLFTNIGGQGFWWSSSESDTRSTYAWCLQLTTTSGDAFITNFFKPWGFSVRCLRD